MKKSTKHFTLIEILGVIGIIVILAGLAIPAVIISRAKGRETQAKSDISSLITALKQVDKDYGKMIARDGSNYKFCDKSATSVVTGDNATYKLNADTFYAMIAELSAPKGEGVTPTLNKRKKVYLEPKKGFDPAVAYTSQTTLLWLDPWDNPYQVYINVRKSGKTPLPGDSTKFVAADVLIYSTGPNGVDDHGCNVDLETCIKGSGNHKDCDDIASWQL